MNEKSNFWLLAVVGIVALVAITAIAVQKRDSESLVGVAAGGKKAPADSGHIWEVLKKQGLQGFHYTLNIHGKKDSFNKQDCDASPDPITGEYGNSIFIPSNGDPADRNQIIMQSGNAKGKWASEADTAWGVRDSCTAPFDGDAAELVIPPSEKGYFVVARVLGKPTNNPELYLEGDLLWVLDEYGNDLLVLGLVTEDGFATPSTTLTRTKGKSKAIDITGLFEWSGGVCYFNPANYCYDEFGTYTCTDIDLCCQDADLNGIYESCVDPYVDVNGTLSCAEGFALTTLACHEYTDEWVFNIGDLVGYMWDAFADGDFKLANIRFYPVK